MFKSPISGYTILEVLIFLGITGFLFITAAVAIGGNQQQVQYSQSVRDFESQVLDVINDVADGYYPDYTQGRCQETGSGINFNNGASGDGPGTSDDCVYIGKSLMFNLSGNTSNFGVATLVGLSPGIGDADLSLSTLEPTMAYKNGGNQINLTTYKPIQYDAQVTKIASVSNPNQQYSSLAFITNFSGAGQNSGNGLLATNVVGIRSTSLRTNPTISNFNSDIEGLRTGSEGAYYDTNLRDGYYICLRSGDGRLARIIVGVDGVATATKTEFDLQSGAVCP
jgi:hypothetical protein